MESILKDIYKMAKLKEQFKENIELDNVNPDLNADKIYQILQLYISGLTETLARRNEDYYKGDKFSTFRVDEFKQNLLSKLKSKIKSRTADEKLIFEGLPKIKEDRGFYEVADFDFEYELFTSDVVGSSSEEIADILIGKTLRH